MPVTPFLDALPLPKVLKPKERRKDGTYYEVRMEEFFHKFHSELNETRVWGYEGQIPGPTIEAEQGECVRVKWINNLPETHFLPVDFTLHGAHENMPQVITVVHLHGAEVEPESDGHPDAWFTNDYKQCGPLFERTVYEYPNRQRPTTLWYHDHALGITRLNVYAGLAGMYIIRNEYERELNLPSGKYEIPLVIQDKQFNPEDGSLFYPVSVDDPPPSYPEPSITPGFAGDTIIVNGKAWPYLEVEQRKYRFRILNASNERFFKMRLDSGQSFTVIGSDGGLLQVPVRTDEITIAPSERYDVIVNFANQAVGSNIILTNTANTPFDFGAPPDPETTGRIMQFRVVARNGEDTSSIPAYLDRVKKINECEAAVIRDISFTVTLDKYQRPLFMLNNSGFMDRTSEEPVAGEVEIWRIINSGLGVHPINIHQIQFQILDRTPFDADLYNQTGQLVLTGPPELPPAYERGWKDTVKTFPGFVTRLTMRFGPYTGRYVYHCHILEHEDHDMMRPLKVLPEKCEHKCEGKCGRVYVEINCRS